jgi:RNA polymerase sigma-70 factor (ECF subfamily)
MSAEPLAAAPRAGAPDPVGRALAGDRDAERELCRRLVPAIRAFAQRRLRPSSVDDFVHDALLLVVEALREGRVREPERVAAYAVGVCRNLARERARMGERRQELFARFGVTESDLVAWDSPPPVRRDHLEDCYSQLTDRARRVIRASFCDDDADGDIARTLAITEANVRIIRHRTLAALRQCLDKPISWVQT